MNWKVVVEPDLVVWKSENKASAERQWQDECERIKDEIARHVDDIQNIRIEYDTEEFCSFCNERWDTDEDGCPDCCNESAAK